MNIMDGLKKALSRRDFIKTTVAGVSVTALGRLGAEAADPLQQPIIIHRAPVGETVSTLAQLNVKGESLMYLTYIAGYDGPYFSNPTVHNETTAYFTVRGTPGGTAGKYFRFGNLMGQEAGVPGGFTTTYFNPTPHGNYAQPDTFSDGIKIGVLEAQSGGFGWLLYMPESSKYDFGTGRSVSMKTFAGSFEIGGKTYTYGAVGDRMVATYFLARNPTDSTQVNVLVAFTMTSLAQ